jgi:hypothetical protein
MVDVRRGLPASSVGVLAGLVSAAVWLEDRPALWMPVVTGMVVLVAVCMSAYLLMGSWTERARRIVGYLATIAVAVVVGAVLAVLALAAALCGGSAERCDDDFLAVALAVGAAVTPILLVGLYTVIDHETHPLRRRR